MRSWEALPEAPVTVARPMTDPAEPIGRFLHEERIAPEQIGAYKVAQHRTHLAHWAHDNARALRGRTLDELWEIREECIAALAQ